MSGTKTGAPEVPSLESVLARLAEGRKRIDDLDDRLATLIKRLEVALRAHLRVEVWTLASQEVIDQVRWDTCLYFGKNGKHDWQLMVVSAPPGEPDIGNPTPLSSCSRETRIEMFENGIVDQLLVEAMQQIEGEIAKRERAVGRAERVTAAAEASGTRDPLVELKTFVDAEDSKRGRKVSK